MLTLLEQGQLDVALVTSPPTGRGFHSVPLYEDEIVMILPGDHPLNGPGEATPADLTGMPSILFARGSGFRRFLDDLFSGAGYRPEVVMELDSIEGIKQLVQIGLGLSFLPRIAVDEELAEGKLGAVPVAGLAPTRRATHVVYPREQFMSAPLRSFLDVLGETYGNGCLGSQDDTRHGRNDSGSAGEDMMREVDRPR